MDKNLIFSNPLKYGNYKYIKSHWPDEYEVVSILSGRNFSEKLYKYLTESTGSFCIMCGKPTKFISIKDGYARCCSQRCACRDPQRQEKIKQTNIKRYGVAHAQQNENIKNKIIQSNTKTYQSGNVQEKIKQINIEKYGVDNPSHIPEVIEKRKQTSLKHYGTEHPMQSDSIKNKVVQTNIERYGVDNPAKTESIKKKIIDTRHKHEISSNSDLIGYMPNGSWQCNCPHQDCNKCVEKYYTTTSQLYNDRKRLGVELCTRLLPIQSSYSTFELQIRKILDSYNIEYQTNVRNIISPQELDIYIPSHKLAIECNGVYWHSMKPPKYHINKYRQCCAAGIQLLTIWEDQWTNSPQKIKNIIESKLGIYKYRIGARNCIVKEITKQESDQILQYHLQGYGSASVRLGLYYNDKLLSVMTFGKRGSVIKHAGWELMRYCTAQGYQIIGGASKLLKYFVSHYDSQQIISFSSNDISNGNLYKILGFKKINESESYWYIDKNMKRYHRYKYRKSELIKLGYNIQLTESQITTDMGLYKIYDTGQTKWAYN